MAFFQYYSFPPQPVQIEDFFYITIKFIARKKHYKKTGTEEGNLNNQNLKSSTSKRLQLEKKISTEYISGQIEDENTLLSNPKSSPK